MNSTDWSRSMSRIKGYFACSSLVLYGIRELAQHYSRPMRVEPRYSSTNESGPGCRCHYDISTYDLAGMELLVCAVHPVPGRFYFLWTTKLSNHGGKIGSQWVPVDVTLSLPMFLRSDHFLCLSRGLQAPLRLRDEARDL